MLVCRHWRKLAVSTPYLWQATKIQRNIEWFKLVLSRSKDLPLDLVFHQPTAILPIVNCLVLLQPHIHRLRSLLIPTIKDMKRLLEFVSRLSMPFLSELDVIAKRKGPMDLSPEQLPALRSLRLSSCVIPWVPTMFPRLHRLDLEDCTCKERSITFEQLLGVLSECVELRELRRHNFLSTLQGPSATTGANRGQSISISIPRLRELNIHDRPHPLSQFLSYVRLDHNTNVRIVGYIPDATVDIRDAFLSLLPQDSSGLPLLRMVTFAEIQVCQYLNCELVGHMGWSYVGPTIALELELGDALPTWTFYLESALRELSIIFARASLSHLRIFAEYNQVHCLDAWVRLFTAFPAIQYLELEGDNPPLSAVAALGQPPYDESELDVDVNSKPVMEGDIMDVAGESDTLVLPDLRSLDLYPVDWCPGLIETIVTVLQRRVAAGLPKLEELRLSLRKTGDERGLGRTMKVYRRRLVSLVEELEDSFSD